jgi:glycosyltransferase involved in cell wall biosynthesis
MIGTGFSPPRKDVGFGVERYAHELMRNLSIIPGVQLKATFVKYAPSNIITRYFERISVANRIKSIKADIYHAVHHHASLPLILSKKKPAIITVHDLFPLSGLRPGLFSKEREHILCQYVFTRCQHIITIANFWKRILVSYLKVDEDKITVVPVGVNLNDFHPSTPTYRRNIREKIVLYVGGLQKEKGLGVLLKAFRKVLKVIPEARLLIAGKGKDEQYFKNLASQLSIDSRTEFLGFVAESQLAKCYSSADVFVYPSFIGMGLMTLEAMACGTPVISTNVFDVPEYLSGAALLIEPGNVDQLARSIISVLSDESLQEEMRKKGFEKVQQLSWRNVAESTLKIYRQFT